VIGKSPPDDTGGGTLDAAREGVEMIFIVVKFETKPEWTDAPR
jgi:hypothetical protein